MLCEIQNPLAAAEFIPLLLDTIVGPFYEPSSYHRVMVYKLDETAADFVASEMVTSRASRNLHRK